MDEIKWGIIGCGNVTEFKSGPAFNKVKSSKLVAVMRRDEEKVKDYALRHKVGRWYTDAEKLINDPEVNAIYIATPPLFHYLYTIAAIQAGKPVYVEKPMSVDAASAQRMAETAEQYGIKMSVAHYRREQPFFKKIKELIDTHYIGDIKYVNMQLLQPHNTTSILQTPDNWRIDPAISGGGFFHDLAPHQLDLMIYFFGNVITATGNANNQSGLYKADDIVSGSILFKNNIIFNGVWSFSAHEEKAIDLCEIVGAEGKISFSVFKNDVIRVTKDGVLEEFTFEKLEHVQQPMIESVVAYFLNESSNPCSSQEGVQVMQLLDAFTKKEI